MIIKTLSIFDVKVKVEAFFLFILNILVALLDIISISSIPIFLYFILDPDKLISKIPFEKVQFFFSNFLSNNTQNENLLLIMIILVFVFFIKNILIFVVNFYQVLFIRKIKTLYTSKLFDTYIKNEYDYFIDRDPASIIKNIDSVGILPSIIMMSLGIVKELSVIFGLMVIIGFTNIYLAIFLSIVLVITFFLHKYGLGKKLNKQGKKTYDYQQSRYAHINEVFGSIADIKILNKEKFFSKIFDGFIWKYETAMTITKIINSTIRPFIETLSVTIMVGLIGYFFYIGKSFNEIIPIISFLALSFIRMIPSATSLISYLNAFKFEENQLSYLVKKFENKIINSEKTHLSPVKKYFFENSLELKNIDFKFKNTVKKSISNFNLRVNKNEQLAIIGKTGSGKSTLINLICNLLKFSNGQIVLNDKTIINPKENYRIENLHYVRQDMYLLNVSVKQNIAFGKNDEEIDDELVIDCLRKVGLNYYVEKLNEPIGERGIKISGGEKQLLCLARALYYKPKFLILDEPTSNLDYKSEKTYFDIIKKLKITTIIVAHRINTLEYCDKIILLKNGSVVDQDSLENFKKKYDNLSNYLN
jgi:ABC-type multidrug transport system fused ATPase/permease subunit